MDRFNDELVSELREPVEKYISRLEQELDGELDSRKIFTVTSDGRIIEKNIPVINDSMKWLDIDREFLTETALWMYESDVVRNQDYIHFEYEDDIIPGYERLITNVAEDTINRAGDFDFDDEHYFDAFNGWISILFDRAEWFGALIPITDFDASFDEISLNDIIDVSRGDTQNSINSISIKKASNRERATIFTSEKSRNIADFRESPDWEYLIRIEGDGSWPENLFDDVADMVVTGLRLFSPDQPDIQPGPRYYIWENDHHYRENIYDWIGKSPTSYKIKRNRGSYELNSSEADQFKRFWEIHRDHLYTGNDDDFTTPMSGAIRRFNFMYRRNIPEDQVLDCMIGLESSLVKDIRGGYSVHLPIRATTLLKENEEYDSEFIYDYFSKLYDARNSIVHQNNRLDDYEIAGKEIAQSDFTLLARVFLAEILINYSKFHSNGMNITQTNQKVLDPVIPNMISEQEDILPDPEIDS